MVRFALVCALVALPLTGSADKLAKPTLLSKKQLRSSKKLCEVTWPKAKKPSVATTNRCMQYWLFTNNYERPKDLSDEDAFTSDPLPVGGRRYTEAAFRAMSRHVTRAFGDKGWAALPAIEFFDASAATYTSTFDMNFNLNRRFKDSLPTKTDRANVSRVAKEEKARKKRK